MQTKLLSFPAVSRLPLIYPTSGQLWSQTLIGRNPCPVVENRHFHQVLWKLPNTPVSIARTALIIFVTNQGLVSIRNVSRGNIIKVIYEDYLSPVRLGPNEEVFVTDGDMFRNLRIEIDNIVTILSANSNSETIFEFERTQ